MVVIHCTSARQHRLAENNIDSGTKAGLIAASASRTVFTASRLYLRLTSPHETIGLERRLNPGTLAVAWMPVKQHGHTEQNEQNKRL